MTTELYRLNARRFERAGLLAESARGQLRLVREGGDDVLVRTRFRAGTLVATIDLGRDLFGPRLATVELKVVFTPLPYGGRRPWFLSPGSSCGRRMVMLYGTQQQYLCRRCRHVTYPMQRIAPENRAIARAQLLRMRLGGSPDLPSPLPLRPKGMHEWTYVQLGIGILAAERKANERMLEMFEHLQIPPRTPKDRLQEMGELDQLFDAEFADMPGIERETPAVPDPSRSRDTSA